MNKVLITALLILSFSNSVHSDFHCLFCGTELQQMASATPQYLCTNCSTDVPERLRHLKSLFYVGIQSGLPSTESQQWESTMTRVRQSLASILSDGATRQLLENSLITEFLRNLLQMPQDELTTYLFQPATLQLLTEPQLQELLLHPAVRTLLFLSGIDTNHMISSCNK
ncbi:hypothetical protein [Endozoicomonas euniceicola]|uniref:Secreted protein n=1 Tax=Endozoicomonas euniceicola TaxID=1234143 RepID=A0ABY6GVW1_9GAMM|nr:hypothetical protein [Endozoicomonas euniceicola]UYM16893.1 hypothetical protein NX720_02915 [Endozoicomonas euniceicola]